MSMNYVPYLNMFGVKAKEIPCLTASGAPTTQTIGAVGLLYMDTSTGALYKCTAVNDDAYIWEEIKAGSGSTQSISAERFEEASSAIGGSPVTGVRITISEQISETEMSYSYVDVYDGSDGATVNGLSVYPFVPGDADLSGSIDFEDVSVTIPSGRWLQAGDLLLADTGELYRVTLVYVDGSSFKAELFTTLGGSGSSLPTGGTAGQVLTIGSDGSPVWADPVATSAEGVEF